MQEGCLDGAQSVDEACKKGAHCVHGACIKHTWSIPGACTKCTQSVQGASESMQGGTGSAQGVCTERRWNVIHDFNDLCI